MPRLIDADAWDSELMSYGFGQAIIGRKIKYTVGEVRSALAKRPTVDAVPVVRCKDCKYWEYDVIFSDGWCRGKHQGNPNWYCADGERKDHAETN